MSAGLRQTACDWCYGVATPERAVEHYRALREIGFHGVEIAEPQHWELARAAGLEVYSDAAPGIEWGLNRREEHDQIVRQVTETIERAGAGGVPAVVVFSGNRRDVADADGVAACIDGLARLVPVADRAGVLLLFEMLASVDHVDYHADRAAFGFEVVRALDTPVVRALYDVYHMHLMGEDVVADITGNVDLIAHIHIAGAPKRDFPGPGQEIDYRGVVAAALAAGYDGRWGHEFLPGDDALGELREAFALFEDHSRGA